MCKPLSIYRLHCCTSSSSQDSPGMKSLARLSSPGFDFSFVVIDFDLWLSILIFDFDFMVLDFDFVWFRLRLHGSEVLDFDFDFMVLDFYFDLWFSISISISWLLILTSWFLNLILASWFSILPAYSFHGSHFLNLMLSTVLDFIYVYKCFPWFSIS